MTSVNSLVSRFDEDEIDRSAKELGHLRNWVGRALGELKAAALHAHYGNGSVF